MTQHKFASFFACLAAALMIATPAMGQLINFPVLALAPGDADGTTVIGAAFARGLNDNSGKQSAFGAGFARGMERVSFGAAGGYVATDFDELTLAARIAVHLLSDSPVQVSLQSGIGWMDSGATLLNFPIGLAIQSNNDGPGRVWVMPRLNVMRISSGGVSNTDSKIGASAGGSYTAEGGIGFNVALDFQRVDNGLEDVSAVLFSAGVHYVLP